MVSLSKLSYETQGRSILEDISFSINRGNRVGLVGLNGAGKTTLLDVINGRKQPTSGEIIKGDENIGMLPQNLQEWLDRSIYSFMEEVTGVKGAREDLDRQCNALADQVDDRTLLLYTDALERYERLEASLFDANLQKALTRAELSTIDVNDKVGNLSGGQRTRVALAAIFASRHDLILLDEPTNNLDERGVIALEEFISASKASFLVVSHDRCFLRNATNRIIELVNGEPGVKQYNLGYDEYIEARESAKKAAIHDYEKQEKEKKDYDKLPRRL